MTIQMTEYLNKEAYMKRELYLEKRRAKTAAKDLKYSNEVLDKIDSAKSVEEIARIMHDARKEIK